MTNFLSPKTPDFTAISVDEIEKMEIPKNINVSDMFNLYAMQLKSMLVAFAKGYDMQQRVKFSKKRFPFPMKIYYNIPEKYVIIGTDVNNKDFENKKITRNEKNKGVFLSFIMLTKLVQEQKYMTIEIIDLEKSVFKFSNGITYKYGFSKE